MKKLFISTIILCLFVNLAFAQSVSITPSGNDEILITRSSATPSFVGRRSSGTSTTPAASILGVELGTFSGRGYTGTTYTSDRAKVSFFTSELFSSTANGTNIGFYTTANGSTALTERMRIENSGKVGINTASAAARLQVDHDGSDSDPHIRINSNGTDGQSRINWTTIENSNKWTAQSDLDGATSADNYWRLEYNGSIFFNVLGDGKTGIGTTLPSKKLHVYNGASGVASFVSSSNFLVEDNISHYIQMGAPEASETGVLFGKPSNSASGGIIYSATNAMILRTGGNINRVTIASDGKVGIGTSAPTAKLDIEGDIVVKKSTVTVAGTYNALNRSSASSIYFNTSGTINLNGIDAGVDGLILYIFCGTSTTLVIGNENASAAASDRIATHTGANVTISGRGGATLIYESTSARWRVVGVAQ